MKRRVAKLVSSRNFEIINETIPDLADNEVLLKVLASGICHTEMPLFSGLRNIVLTKDGKSYVETEFEFPVGAGHEPVGIVEKVGNKVDNFKPGDYAGGLIKGAFASHLITDKDHLVKIPNKKDREAKYCLPEPLMCISNILRAANPKFGDMIGIIGCGVMGLLSIAGLKNSPVREIVAIDLSDYRLKLAQQMGASITLNPNSSDMVKEINYLTEGKGLDIIIEITGTIKGLDLACSIITYASLYGYQYQGRGKIIAASLYANQEKFEPSLGYNLMFRTPIIHSVHPRYSQDSMKDAKLGVWGYINNHLPLDKLVTHEFKLENINKAFEIAEKGDDKYIKGIIVP